MGRLLTALMLSTTLLLAGCGADAPDEASEAPSSTPTSEPEPEEPEMSIGDPVQEPTIVALLSGTEDGGRVTTQPTDVGDPEAMAAFTSDLDPRLARDLADAGRDAEIPDGQTLLAAVVAIGCDPVEDVRVKVGDGGPMVVAAAQKSDRQCADPVTTVALVTAIL